MNRSRKRSNFNITGASSQREREKPSSQSQIISAPCNYHILNALRYTDYYQKALEEKAKYVEPRRRCVICGVHSSVYCTGCSTDLDTDRPNFVAVCSPLKECKGDCLKKHIEQYNLTHNSSFFT